VLDAQLVTLDRGVRAVRLQNDLIATSVLPDKGADIYELIHRPSGIDVLWKSPWGVRRPGGGFPTASSSAVSWIENYEGGWQLLFPSGGGPCEYKGVELNFHGEASSIAWDIAELGASSNGAIVRLGARLARSPYRLEREMIVTESSASILIREQVQNEGGEPMDYMWGHHPAFGAPFLGEECRIDTNATTIISDDAYDPPHNPMSPGTSYRWPVVSRDGTQVDLTIVPGATDKQAALAYLTDFDGETAWYGITNTRRGLGAGLAWKRDDFPCAWFWQEMHASPGFPWYQGVYVMAIEPNTSYPGQGLVAVTEKTQTQRTLQPGELVKTELRAVLYESNGRVSGIDLDGSVSF
jgi:hypothetical protein